MLTKTHDGRRNVDGGLWRLEHTIQSFTTFFSFGHTRVFRWRIYALSPRVASYWKLENFVHNAMSAHICILNVYLCVFLKKFSQTFNFFRQLQVPNAKPSYLLPLPPWHNLVIYIFLKEIWGLWMLGKNWDCFNCYGNKCKSFFTQFYLLKFDSNVKPQNARNREFSRHIYVRVTCVLANAATSNYILNIMLPIDLSGFFSAKGHQNSWNI